MSSNRPDVEEQIAAERAVDATNPSYYRAGGVEVIDFIQYNYGLDSFTLGNAVKYLARAGKKSSDPRDDLKKAIWYIERAIHDGVRRIVDTRIWPRGGKLIQIQDFATAMGLTAGVTNAVYALCYGELAQALAHVKNELALAKAKFEPVTE